MYLQQRNILKYIPHHFRIIIISVEFVKYPILKILLNKNGNISHIENEDTKLGKMQ